MLFRQGWRWTACSTKVSLSEEGLVATRRQASIFNWWLATGGEPMTEGRHYWEVEITKWAGGGCMLGAVRPGLDHDTAHWATDGAYFINAFSGSLYGNGKRRSDEQGKFAPGDRVGVLLDLDAGWLRFYRNDQRCGPGFTEGVTGPLVRAAQFGNGGVTLTVLPGAVVPEGAGAADEPWEEPPAPEAGY
jgi:hypothetical protein